MEKTPKRVLVIDDDSYIQAALEIVFKNAGFYFMRAQSAAEGLCELASAAYDLVIIDSLLPDKSGAALCERIRSLKRYKDLKIIYYSAFFKKAEGLSNHESGVAADLALQKPVNPEAVLQHAVKLLGGRRGIVAQLYGAPFNELRNEFNGAFHIKLQEIESPIDDLAQGDAQEPILKKLLFAAHRLHGASALFGHPLVGETAAIWEEELETILETSTPVTPLTIGKFRFYFDWLKLNFQPPAQQETLERELREMEGARQAAAEAAVAEDVEAPETAQQEETEPEEESVSVETAAPVEDILTKEETTVESEAALEEIEEPDTEDDAAPERDAVPEEVAEVAASEKDTETEELFEPEDEAAREEAEEEVAQEELAIEVETEPEAENVSEEEEPAPQGESAAEDKPAAQAPPKSDKDEESSAFVDEVLSTIAATEKKKQEQEQPLGVLDEEDIVASIEVLTTPAIPETSKTGEDKAAAITKEPSTQFGGPDILIVDDDPVVQRLVSYALGLRGFSHETIGDGDSARIRLFEKGCPPPPRIILLDVDLPGTDGFTLLREIKETAGTCAIKVIMVSAHGREEDLLRGFECGATDFIIKPFSVPILAHKIRIAMASFCDLRVGG